MRATKKRPGGAPTPTEPKSPENLAKENGMTSEPNSIARRAKPDGLDALSELETPMQKVKDRANLLLTFAELTISNTAYNELHDEHRDALLVMIGDAFDAAETLHRVWNEEWDKRRTSGVAA